MTAKRWYEELFENYGRKYDAESFAQGTVGECDFIDRELGGDKSGRILDIGCGTGRHSIELTRRGYRMTGVDLSESMLSRAREKAKAAGLAIDFRRQDARDLWFSKEFDAVIMMCEGAFPLMETDEMNYAILEGATRALKDGGRFIFTTLNGLFPLHHSVEKFCSQSTVEGGASYHRNTFDLMTFRDHSITVLEDDSGRKMELESDERYYVPSEITWMLKTLGYREVDIFGAKLGAFSRNDKLTTDDFEMLVVARKA